LAGTTAISEPVWRAAVWRRTVRTQPGNNEHTTVFLTGAMQAINVGALVAFAYPPGWDPRTGWRRSRCSPCRSVLAWPPPWRAGAPRASWIPAAVFR